jgi:soluble lytic murein transglycosylase-like protein
MDKNNKEVSLIHWHTILIILILTTSLILNTVSFKTIEDENKSLSNLILVSQQNQQVLLEEINILKSQVAALPKEEKIETTIIPVPIIQQVSLPKTERELIDLYVEEICKKYSIRPELVKSMIFHESTYRVNAVNGDGTCVGLMQVSTRWHADRAKKLGVTDFYDPYSNILVGVDFLSELLKSSDGDESLALMMYNMDWESAQKLYSQGKESSYAKNVLARAEELKE